MAATAIRTGSCTHHRRRRAGHLEHVQVYRVSAVGSWCGHGSPSGSLTQHGPTGGPGGTSAGLAVAAARVACEVARPDLARVVPALRIGHPGQVSRIRWPGRPAPSAAMARAASDPWCPPSGVAQLVVGSERRPALARSGSPAAT